MEAKASRHESAADTLADSAIRLHQDGHEAVASLAIKGCHAHRVWALMARTRANALKLRTEGNQH